jgi:hypothetical protein
MVSGFVNDHLLRIHQKTKVERPVDKWIFKTQSLKAKEIMEHLSIIVCIILFANINFSYSSLAVLQDYVYLGNCGYQKDKAN